MKISINEVIIENDTENEILEKGFCVIKIFEEHGKWLELHGNEVKPPYPLCFDSHEDIDYFCDKLHNLLDGKLIPTGFIKE